MSCTRQDVLAKLAETPRWIDTASMAQQVGSQRGTVSAILSKFAMYGKIERRPVPGGNGRTYEYRSIRLPHTNAETY